jgi:hypothetical protein
MAMSMATTKILVPILFCCISLNSLIPFVNVEKSTNTEKLIITANTNPIIRYKPEQRSISVMVIL